MTRLVAESACHGCKYLRECGGFHDRVGRCPEWVINERRGTEIAEELRRLEEQYDER